MNQQKSNHHLSKNINYYEPLFKHAAIGIGVCDLHRNFLKVNPYFCKMLGYTENELTKMNVSDITHPDDLDLNIKLDNSILEKKISEFTVEKRYIHKDGSIFWVLLTVTDHKIDEDNHVFIAQVQNISEQKEREQLMESLLKEITDGVAIANKEGKIVHVNKSGEIMLGKGETDRPKEYWSSEYGAFKLDTKTPFPTEELPMVKALNGEVVTNIELFVRNENKPEGIYLSADARPILSLDGKTNGAYVIFHDISEKFRSLNRHGDIEQESRFLEIYEDDKIGVVQIGADRKILSVDSSLQKMTGLSEYELQKKNILDLIDKQDISKFCGDLGALEHNKIHSFSSVYRIITKLKTQLWVNMVMTKPSQNNPEILAIIHDVSHIRNQQVLLERFQMKLRRLSGKILKIQEEEKTKLSREIHDNLGQLIAATKLDTERCLKLITNPNSEKMISEVRTKFEHLLSELRGISKNLRPLGVGQNLSQSLEKLLTEFRKSSSIKIQYQLHPVEPVGPLEKDIMIYRVVQEAINNVIKHSKATQIDISFSEGRFCLLQITDNGIGFDTTNVGEGLGLLNMQERMNLIGGEFSIESIIGTGTKIGLSWENE